MLQPQKMHRARHANPAVIPANAGIHSLSLRAVDMRAWAFGQRIPARAQPGLS